MLATDPTGGRNPFYTLQGEGPQAGWPAVFVRLAKCNLRCYFCDTPFEEGQLFQLDEIVKEIDVQRKSANGDCNLVVITGGEPLLQNVIPLIETLNRAGILVSIETAGTVYVDGLRHLFPANPNPEYNNMIVCSPKTPRINPSIIPLVGAYKYIIRAGEVGEDGLPMLSTQNKSDLSKLFRPKGAMHPPIYVQPMDEGAENPEANRRNRDLAVVVAMQHGYRLSLQTHKLVGLP